MKKIFAILLALVMILSITACASKPEPEAPTESAPAESAAPSPEAEASPDVSASEEPAQSFRDDYLIGYNNLGTGVWILDFYCSEASYFVEDIMGFGFQSLSANFTAEQLERDCKNLISTGIDGHMYYGAFDSLTLNISNIFAEAKIPFAMPDQMPISDVSRDAVLSNPYFVGAVGVDSYALGYNMGERAAEMGYERAMIIAGTIGNPSHDNKVNGFTDSFTAGGGEVLGVARCQGTAEATDKATDLFAAYSADADCVYAGQTDFANAAIAAMELYGVNLMVFASEADYTTFDKIGAGTYVGDGGGAVTTSLTAALLVNYLDGKQIVDESGTAPIFMMTPFIIDADNVDGFNTNWIENHPLNESVYETLLYRYSPDVDYGTWTDFLSDYGYDYIMNFGG